MSGPVKVCRQQRIGASRPHWMSAPGELVVFAESFVPGYPDWVWRHKPLADSDWYSRFQEQAVDVSGPALDKACAAAEAFDPTGHYARSDIPSPTIHTTSWHGRPVGWPPRRPEPSVRDD